MPQPSPADPQPTPSKRPAKPRRLRRWAVRLLIALIVLLVGSELFCRFYLGLGDPPLMVADAEMEYRFKPSATYKRFGHRVSYNAYSMRSDPFPEHKTDPSEFRVLVIGDSIVNGGSLTDQSELATSLLQDWLHKDLGRPVFVGNVSAGSWGPPNELAYVKKYGLFDADVVVLVLNSGDYADAPTFTPVVGVNPNFPDHAPTFALQEVMTRYLPRFFPKFFPEPPGEAPTPPTTPEVIKQCMDAEREIFRTARAAHAAVFLMQYEVECELGAPKAPDYVGIRAVGLESGVPILDNGPAYAAARATGAHVYRDSVHPSAAGQKILADLLLGPIEDVAREPKRSAPTTRAAH